MGIFTHQVVQSGKIAGMNTSTLQEHLQALGLAARSASALMARASAQQKAHALRHLAQQLLAKEHDLIEANQRDLKNAKDKGLTGPMFDR